MPVAGLGLVEPPLFLRDHAELVVGAGGGVPVAGLQEDVEGLPVAGLGLVEPPLFLRDPAELVVGAGGGVPVAGLQVDVEGLPVAGLLLVEPPLLLGDDAELVVGAGGGVPVAELQLDVEGLPVAGLGLGRTAAAPSRRCRAGDRCGRRSAGRRTPARCRGPAGSWPRPGRTAAVLARRAELVIGAGGGVPVAELQLDVEGLPVAGLGLVEPPLFLRDPAELVVGDAQSRRSPAPCSSCASAW